MALWQYVNLYPLRTKLRDLLLPKSLFLRMAIIQFVILMLLAVAACISFDRQYKLASDRSEQISAWHLAQKVAAELQMLSDFSYWELEKVFSRWNNANTKLDLYLLDLSGRIVADSGGDDKVFVEVVPIEPLLHFLSSTSNIGSAIYSIDPRNPKDPTVFSLAKVTLNSSDYYLYAVLKNNTFKRIFIVSQVSSIIAGVPQSLIASLVIASLVGGILFYLVTTRLREATKVLANFKRGDFSERLTLTDSTDEIGMLLGTINTMADAIDNNLSELKKKDELRRELIATVSHDLKSPAAVISCLSEVILTDPELTERSKKHCCSILESCKSLNRLLSELFDLAKLEARELKPQISSVRIDELLDELASVYKTTAKSVGVSVNVEYPLNIPAVLCDDTMITRVLTNLIENSIRHTPEGGVVTLSAEVDDVVRISVSDTGAGIPSLSLPHVFEKFYQVKQSSGMNNGLSGLGLAIVKKIIEAHESDIHVSSTEGLGTKFTFELRISPKQ